MIPLLYALFVIACFAAITFSIWYYFDVKKPVDREQREGERAKKEKRKK